MQVTSSQGVAKETLTPHAKTAGEVASVEARPKATEELPERQDVAQLDRCEMMGVLSSALKMGHCKYYGHHI